MTELFDQPFTYQIFKKIESSFLAFTLHCLLLIVNLEHVIMAVDLLRDLVRTSPAFLLYRQSPENLFLDRQKILGRIFKVDFFGLTTKSFPNKPTYRTWQKCKLAFLTK